MLRALFYLLLTAATLLLGYGFAIEPTNQSNRHAVLEVLDGDTIVVEYQGSEKRVRLAQIDAPETAQPFGPEAKQALTELLRDKSVGIAVETTDRYGRLVAEVVVNGDSVNAQLVKRGAAWVYRQYAHDESYYDYEAEARKAGLGLWAAANPTPPWEWRRARRH